MHDPLDSRYVSLATFRRDGREVRTPVWIAASEGRYYVFTETRAGKTKRLRANGRARLAPCTARGQVHGAWQEARGRIVDAPETVARAYRALRAKYGWQMRLLDWMSRLSGRYDARAIIELEPT
jgi:PPOX class probable F420-dependent enzyme